MANDLLLSKNKQLLDQFVDNRSINKKYTILDPDQKVFGYIYCIENKTNHKKYIGSVYAQWTGVSHPTAYTEVRKRASNYIYEYHQVSESGNIIYNRPIIQAMVDEGIENFVMYPIAETTISTHKYLELYFIQYFDTVKTGYNVVLKGAGIRTIGTPHNAEAKKVRSEKIICINLNSQKILFSDSMKLFADYMNTSKDMIKNCNRLGRSYKGWFIFYISNDKRQYVLNLVINGKIQHTNQQSIKSRLRYKELCDIVSKLINDSINRNEYFSNFEYLDPLEYID